MSINLLILVMIYNIVHEWDISLLSIFLQSILVKYP